MSSVADAPDASVIVDAPPACAVPPPVSTSPPSTCLYILIVRPKYVVGNCVPTSVRSSVKSAWPTMLSAVTAANAESIAAVSNDRAKVMRPVDRFSFVASYPSLYVSTNVSKSADSLRASRTPMRTAVGFDGDVRSTAVCAAPGDRVSTTRRLTSSRSPWNTSTAPLGCMGAGMVPPLNVVTALVTRS